MNETINRWAGTENLETYTWGYREYEPNEFIVCNNHGSTFDNTQEVVIICEACGMSYYLSITKNADGEDTPAICIY